MQRMILNKGASQFLVHFVIFVLRCPAARRRSPLANLAMYLTFIKHLAEMLDNTPIFPSSSSMMPELYLDSSMNGVGAGWILLSS